MSPRRLEAPDDEAKIIVTPARADDTADRGAADDAAPESTGRIPGQHGDLPRAGEAHEERAGDARADAAPPIAAQHEELADLLDAGACKVSAATHQGEARRPAIDPHDEVVAAAPPPKASMPIGRTKRAVRLDAPAIAAE